MHLSALSNPGEAVIQVAHLEGGERDEMPLFINLGRCPISLRGRSSNHTQFVEWNFLIDPGELPNVEDVNSSLAYGMV